MTPNQPLLPESPCNARNTDQPVLPESPHIKRLCRQIAGNLSSHRSHPAMAKQLTDLVERDFPGLAPDEAEAVAFFIRRLTNT